MNKYFMTLDSTVSTIISKELERKYMLDANTELEDNGEQALRDTLLAREVALYVDMYKTIDDNTFHVVELPMGGKTVAVSVGRVKTKPGEPSKLTYGYIYI